LDVVVLRQALLPSLSSERIQMSTTAYPRRQAVANASNDLAATFPTSLEEELNAILRAAGLQGRQARAVAARLGWSGRGVTTLASAGEEEGYTRERVRQLEGRLRRHADATPLPLPLTATALRLVENAAPIARRDVPGKLALAGLSAGQFDLSGVLSAAALGGLEVRVCERDGVVLREGETELADDVGLVATALVARNGAGSVEVLAEHFSDDPDTARLVLEAQSDVVWLDDGREWFLVRGARSPLTNLLRKMLSVAGSLSLADVDDGLQRAFRPVRLPRNVLQRLCETTSWLVVDETLTVTSKVALDETRFLSRLEQAVVRILRANGPELAFSDALRLGEQEGLNPNSVGLYLLRSPVVAKVARGRYVLRGSGAARRC
jgi:hypothetical protein